MAWRMSWYRNKPNDPTLSQENRLSGSALKELWIKEKGSDAHGNQGITESLQVQIKGCGEKPVFWGVEEHDLKR